MRPGRQGEKGETAAMDWTVSLPNSYVDALFPHVTVFGNGDL